MESLSHHPFPDLKKKDGIYFFPGGYLIIQGEEFQVLRHDNERNNLEHLHKKHKIRGKLPEEYLARIKLPDQVLNAGTDQIRGLIQKNLENHL